jgi:hypothetical protein
LDEGRRTRCTPAQSVSFLAMRNYAGSMLAIILGLVVDLTAGKLGLHWWYLVGIGLVTLVIAGLLWPRGEESTPPPAPDSAVFYGELINNTVSGKIDTDADFVHHGRGEGNRWLGKIRQRRSR